MTATTISTGSCSPRRGPASRRHAPRPAARQSAAVYGRRRAAAALLVTGALAAGGLVADGVLRGPGGVPASAAGAAPAVVLRSTVARPGDTLWGIAHARHGDVDVERYLDALIDLNGGTRIDAGQLVRLP